MILHFGEQHIFLGNRKKALKAAVFGLYQASFSVHPWFNAIGL
jgi:hypothetical protein